MSGLQFVAAILNSLAWPIAVVVAVGLLRQEMGGAIHRIKSVEFPGGKATFATLVEFEGMTAVTAKDAEFADDEAIVRPGDSEFSMLQTLASAAPAQAIIDAWGLLEYQLNRASDRLAPDQPHGWPQVADNLKTWDRWALIYPAVAELRRLRDYTVQSSQPPSSADATRYVSVTQNLVTTLRAAMISGSGLGQDGDE